MIGLASRLFRLWKQTGVADRTHDRALDSHFRSLRAHGRETSVQSDIAILDLVDWPQIGVESFVTRGLSRYLLKNDQSAKLLRQELAITVGKAERRIDCVGLLGKVVTHALRTGKALPTPALIDMPLGVINGNDESVAHLFICSRVWLPSQVAMAVDGNFSIIELVPVTESESRLIDADPDWLRRASFAGEVDILDPSRTVKGG